MTNPVITAYNWSPDRGRGLVRDMRVRWALEEVGRPYDIRYLSWGQQKEPAHRARNPFGQVPAYEEGDLVLFESGAIVFHIAERHAGLLPADADARARAITWMFAALSTVEPPIVDRSMATILDRDKSWHVERLPELDRGGDTVLGWHLDVYDGDVRPGRESGRDNLVATADFGDDFDVALQFEQAAHRGAEHHLVLGEQDANHDAPP